MNFTFLGNNFLDQKKFSDDEGYWIHFLNPLPNRNFSHGPGT